VVSFKNIYDLLIGIMENQDYTRGMDSWTRGLSPRVHGIVDWIRRLHSEMDSNKTFLKNLYILTILYTIQELVLVIRFIG